MKEEMINDQERAAIRKDFEEMLAKKDLTAVVFGGATDGKHTTNYAGDCLQVSGLVQVLNLESIAKLASLVKPVTRKDLEALNENREKLKPQAKTAKGKSKK